MGKLAAVGYWQPKAAYGGSRRLGIIRHTYTLSVYYYIVTDIYLNIISISYINYISEYIVYKNKIYRGFWP